MTTRTAVRKEFLSLGEGLKAEGFAAIRFYRIQTRRQLFALVGKGNLRREETDDIMYSIEAVYEGKRCRIYTNHPEETKTVIRLLKETAEVYGETSGEAILDTSRKCRNDGRFRESEEDAFFRDNGEEAFFRKNGEDAFLRESGEEAFFWDEPCKIKETLGQAWEIAKEAPMIRHVSRCTYEQVCREIQMMDEELHTVCDRDGFHCFTFGAAAGAGDMSASAADCVYGSQLAEIDTASCVRRVIREAETSVGGEKLPSGRYPVILGGKVTAELLDAYLGAFFAGNLQRGESPLKGKERVQIAAPGLWLREIPGWNKGKSIRTVDDEGNAVTEKEIIQNGVFCQPFYNEETARKAGVKSTGNGFRPSIQEDVQTGITTVVLGMEAEHTATRNGLEEAMGDGLLITRVDGVFAGADARTGTFSLIAGGRRVRNGKEAEPFREVTISGDFFEVLRQVRQAGDEIYITEPSAASVLAPDFFIGELTVSGT